MKHQVYNPYLPLGVCIPDGEPHVFGNRVYLYGSHDKEGGETFCMLNYEVWSAPVDDLTDWRCEGIIYRAAQDPDYPNRKFMYAPDVVQGNDGRYYLYYCMSGDFGVGGYHGPISVAVCDTPAGKFEYLGFIRWKDGTPMQKYVCFDPAVINDNGTIRLYYGTQYDFEERPDFPGEGEWAIRSETEMFAKSREEILGTPESVMGPSVLTLEDDMLTVRDEPVHIIPYRVKGTDFEAHPFFEAASMRKVGERYYFVYSSQLNHELCYAVSDRPDGGFRFGGTIVSNCDVGYEGRTQEERANMTGTTHGSIIEIGGQWYVFYHRLTHKSDYSRQACAERIEILPDGSIPQVCITSCGLNGGALAAQGSYPAPIACHITNGHMPHGSNKIYDEAFPHVTNDGACRFIAQIADGTRIGYRYFDFTGDCTLTLRVKSTDGGRFDCTDENGNSLGSIPVPAASGWTEASGSLSVSGGTHALFLTFRGAGEAQFESFRFA
ncbi:MAG: family 43 glycosylhydrolase [Oscillospiraceae bacterium]|nr:family 43 glycosylhydrolase [Oscillospiraceae bacterium]